MFVLQHGGSAYEVLTLQILGAVFQANPPYAVVGPGPYVGIGFSPPTRLAGPDGVSFPADSMSWGIGFVQVLSSVGGLAMPIDGSFMTLAAPVPQAGSMPEFILAGVLAFASGRVTVTGLTAVVDFSA